MECDKSDRRLHDLKDISEKLCGPSNQVLDIPQALVATGHFPYQDFPPTHRTDDTPLELGTVVGLTKQGRRVVVCNILRDLCDEGIITINQFVSTDIDDDEEQYESSEDFILAGSGVFPKAVGDYTRYIRRRPENVSHSYISRYKFCEGRPFSLEIGRTTTTSLHDPEVSETRRRIPEYFHRRLPSLLERSWVTREPTDGFVLGIMRFGLCFVSVNSRCICSDFGPKLENHKVVAH